MDAIAELNRKIENMIRIGTVFSIDYVARRVRVKSGKLETQWLKWATPRAGDTREWDPPTIGEQVMVLSPSGVIENGVVMPSVFSSAHDAPSSSATLHVTEYPDGARVAYDHDAGALTATGIKTALVQASASVTADTPYTHITGDTQIDGTLTVNGLLTYRNGISGSGGGNGNIVSGNFIQTGGELSSEGVVLSSHVHTGVVPGGGESGGPA